MEYSYNRKRYIFLSIVICCFLLIVSIDDVNDFLLRDIEDIQLAFLIIKLVVLPLSLIIGFFNMMCIKFILDENSLQYRSFFGTKIIKMNEINNTKIKSFHFIINSKEKKVKYFMILSQSKINLDLNKMKIKYETIPFVVDVLRHIEKH